jgi:hypothetical protein
MNAEAEIMKEAQSHHSLTASKVVPYCNQVSKKLVFLLVL